jgi:hypothetical protein
MAGSRAGLPVSSLKTVTMKRTSPQNPRNPMMMSKSSPERILRTSGFEDAGPRDG